MPKIEEVVEAGNWFEKQLRELGVDEETIATRCHLLGQLCAIMPETPMKIAEGYLEQFKKPN